MLFWMKHWINRRVIKGESLVWVRDGTRVPTRKAAI